MNLVITEIRKHRCVLFLFDSLKPTYLLRFQINPVGDANIAGLLLCIDHQFLKQTHGIETLVPIQS